MIENVLLYPPIRRNATINSLTPLSRVCQRKLPALVICFRVLIGSRHLSQAMIGCVIGELNALGWLCTWRGWK